MMINKKTFLKLIKNFILNAVICYSTAICIANVLYYKYEKKEILFFPKINFGIDIVGGNQLTLAIDTMEIFKETSDNNKEFLSSYCKNKNIDCNIILENDYSTKVIVKKSKQQDSKVQKQLMRDIRAQMVDYKINITDTNKDNFIINIILNIKNFEKMASETTDKAIAVLKNRIDGIGVKEISIQRYGNDKIIILVPKGSNIEKIKEIIKTTAKLDFYLMDRTHIFSKKPQQIMKNHILLPSYKTSNNNSLLYMVEEKPALSGSCISNTQPVVDGISNAINFRLNSVGTKKFAEITKNNIGRLLAIVLDGKILMAPMINTPIINGNGSITGNFSSQEVQDLSVLLHSGSLPVKISIISERLLSSVFNKDTLSSLFIVVCFCLLSVILLMISRYKKLGIITFITLFLNFVFIIAIMSIFGFTLTMPGIAGLILMLGMATDANILIYEKMKELKKQGIENIETIVKNSFSKSIGTILDANITTIIAGIALFSFGGSFIKGFSITLIFGIFCSLFISTNITKLIVNKFFKINV